MRTKSLIPLAIAAALTTTPALAQYTSGSVMVRVGASYVDPSEDIFTLTESFFVDDPSTDDEESVLTDVVVDLDLDTDTTWYVSFAWMAADHWGVELYHSNSADLDANFAVDVFADDVLTNGGFGSIGDFEMNTTSLFANWYPLDATCMIQPYVGVGAAYVDIEQDFLRPVFVDDGSAEGLLNFGSDFSWTAQVGVDFNFGRDSAWQVNVSAMYVDASPELELGYDQRVDAPGFAQPDFVPVRVRQDMDIDPWIFNLGVGYKFSF
ncbi:OmpW family protein [Microbulbifer sp. ALW1]|uniref:OmpW/AlkL family protein n=1 Tax=Microbulbifer sp. (strain ALW1) TaxID=1516059 RepID=UPI0013573EA7|nr:OmpW family outer membrane protein [Microbulbifer sp. ALW1]